MCHVTNSGGDVPSPVPSSVGQKPGTGPGHGPREGIPQRCEREDRVVGATGCVSNTIAVLRLKSLC